MKTKQNDKTSDRNLSQPRRVIDVKGLVTHYGDRLILQGVTMNVLENEIMVIMGGSGSGKSTLLRHLMALETKTSGTMKILGHDIDQLNRMEFQELRKQIGVAFQGGALFSSMTIGENVMLPLYEHTNLDYNTMEIMSRMKLEIVELGGFEKLMPSELSGGMIKRAAFARAIVMDPRILCCDEPSAGLDPVAASALDDLILNMRDAMGMSIIVVTHELESTFKIADRITILDRGKILMVGTVDEVKASKNERVQALLNRVPEVGELDPDEYLDRLVGDEDSGRAHL